MGRAPVRPSLATVCVAMPPLVLAATTAVMLLATALGMRPLWPRTPLTPAEAIEIGDEAAFIRLVAAGADPNARSSVGPGLGRDSTRMRTPLEAAIIRGQERTLETVRKMGASISGDTGRDAVCLAYEETPDLIPVLVRYGAPFVEEDACRVRGAQARIAP
jgi:hypothetical protein